MFLYSYVGHLIIFSSALCEVSLSEFYQFHKINEEITHCYTMHLKCILLHGRKLITWEILEFEKTAVRDHLQAA